MFDIGFWELAVIAVIALIVVGPEEFPSLVRNISRGIAKLRQYISAVKSDMDFEIDRVEELKRLIEQEAKVAEMEELAKSLDSRITATHSDVAPESRGKNNELDKQRSVKDPAKKHVAGPSNGSE